ncbi:nuclear transport factor 2 family protein [Hymenobacter sp.]|jgi:hypothetical protein|uniref:nuclear transport factor 2 family protein n=1 Tax=Hymenobacter sp. TaxID=1898978 RepID=UPI002ED7A403
MKRHFVLQRNNVLGLVSLLQLNFLPMHYLLLSAFLVSATCATAQTTAAATAEPEAVKKTIQTFFEGMRKGDSTLVRSTFAPGAVFHTIANRNGTTELRSENPSEFVKAVGKPHKEIWDERITFDKVLIDANLASVWTPYEFYLGSTFSHCGYNSFQLVKLAGGWKIAHVIDTRRKEKCK